MYLPPDWKPFEDVSEVMIRKRQWKRKEKSNDRWCMFFAVACIIIIICAFYYDKVG